MELYFIDEFSIDDQNQLKDWCKKNMVMIIGDVIRGRGRFAAEWTLVIHRLDKFRWTLKSVNEAVGIYIGEMNVEFTKQGNIHLGNITLQRKGGDNGAESANMLQFKANPLDLFDIK